RLAGAPPGLAAHTRHPWVVATDRLTGAGWSATLSHEEAYVATSPGTPWSRLSPHRRQNLILFGALAALVATAAGAVAGGRALRRRHA
nr:hypothetical protein [Acidimicrobiia bacterium]